MLPNMRELPRRTKRGGDQGDRQERDIRTTVWRQAIITPGVSHDRAVRKRGWSGTVGLVETVAERHRVMRHDSGDEVVDI